MSRVSIVAPAGPRNSKTFRRVQSARDSTGNAKALDASSESDHGGSLFPSTGRRQSAKASKFADDSSRRATAVSFFMLSMMKQSGAEDQEDIQMASSFGVDFSSDGMVKPVIVSFFEKASAIIHKGLSDESGVDDDEQFLSSSESSDDDGEKSDNSGDTDKAETTNPKILIAQLQDNLTQGENFAMLASLLTTHTFSLKDRRLDQILGSTLPLRIRKTLILELMYEIDALWEKFGKILISLFGSYEKAFEQLDDDSSGFVDRSEFLTAYVDMNMRHLRRTSQENELLGDSEKSSPRSEVARRSVGPRGQQASIELAAELATSATKRGSLAGAIRRQSLAQQVAMRASKENVDKINKVILKAEAGFLFDMVRMGEKGLSQEEDDFGEDVTISMQHLVMRLTGVGERTMESLREWIVRGYSNVMNAFKEYGKEKKDELLIAEFEKLYRNIYKSRDAQQHLTWLGVPGGLEDAVLSERARRIFNGIDIDGGGTVGVREMRRALSAFGPSTSFGIFRRRLLLQYGTFETFFSQRPKSVWKSEEDVDAFAFELDITSVDGRSFLQRFGLLLSYDAGIGNTSAPPTIPGEGYSAEEFAISVFMNKPEEMTIEELVSKRWVTDRDREITFREFAERLGASDSAAVAAMGGRNDRKPPAAVAALANRAAGSMATGQLGEQRRRDRQGTSNAKALANTTASILPVVCRLRDLKTIYESLEQEHRRFTLGIFLRAMANVSDYIAIDRTSYQSGDRIVCRVRLTSDAVKRCKERPILAVVPERLEWKDQGSKSHWLIDGEKITDLTTICEHIQELPRTQAGAVLKEFFIRITAPFTSSADEKQEIRIIASSNGKEPGKQVGRSVPFGLLMPAPHAPLVDQLSLNAATGEASVVLHWSPPLGTFAAAPIENFVIQVKPLIYEYHQIVDRGRDKKDSSGSTYKEVIVWSPTLKAFTKKLSYGIDKLQRGVQYRFGVQCVHTRPDTGRSDSKSREFRGAPSELCDLVTMPLYNVTAAPGNPVVTMGKDSNRVELVWTSPSDESMSDSNRICTFLIQYRHTAEDAPPSQAGSPVSHKGMDGASDAGSVRGEDGNGSESNSFSSGSRSSSRSEMEDDEESGWHDIDEACVFISAPRWADFIGWQVPAHIYDLEGVEGTFDTHLHEFRVCAVNYAGASAWSKPSDPIRICQARPGDGAEVDMYPVQNLEVVDVQGVRGESRTQCILRWLPPPSVSDCRYTIHMRDATQVRSEGGWQNAQMYMLQPEEKARRHTVQGAAIAMQRQTSAKHKSSIAGQTHEALIVGLEKFPSFATIQLQVRATCKQVRSTSTAQIELAGMEGHRLDPPVKGPEWVQVHFAAHGPPAVELQWFVSEGTNVEVNPFEYVVQASHCAKGTEQWSDFETIEDVWFSPCQEDRSVTCFARILEPDGLHLFRICARRPKGLLEPSPVCDMPLDWSDKAHHHSVMGRMHSHSRNSMQACKEAEEAAKPRKPRNVSIVSAEREWCEITWEQRVPLGRGQSPPVRYEVEECSEEFGEALWRPVKATYVCMEDMTATDENETWQVRGASFFVDKADTKSSSDGVLARWRVRVRALTDDGVSDWSSPSAWRQPASAPPPAQLSIPNVISNEQQYVVLEWEVLQTDAENHSASYDLQLQTRQPYGSRFSDWMSVPIYTSQELQLADAHQLPQAGSFQVFAEDAGADLAKAPSLRKSRQEYMKMRGIVLRQDVVEAARSPNDIVRFRVRVGAAGGVTGLPSNPSECVAVLTSLPSPPTPPLPETIGSGRLLLEPKDGDPINVEFVQIQWTLDDTTSEATSSAVIPHVSFTIELQGEEACWVPCPGAMIELDRAAGLAHALVLLPSDRQSDQDLQFRVAANRVCARDSGVGGLTLDAQPAYSSASPPVVVGKSLELAEPPVVVDAEPLWLRLRFRLSEAQALGGIESVSALIEVHRSFNFEAKTVPNDEPRVVEDSDGSDFESDASESGFDFVGEFPVYFWKAGAFTTQMDGAASYNDRDGMALKTAEKGCLCEGVVVIDGKRSNVPGHAVRASIRIQKVGEDLEQAPVSMHSFPSRVSEATGLECASLLLDYPAWAASLQPDAIIDVRPRLMTGGGEDREWQEEPLQERIKAGGASPVQFRIAKGSLPYGLELDPSSGAITGHVDSNMQASFAVEMSVLTSWLGPGTALVRVGTAAATHLRSGSPHTNLEELNFDIEDQSALLDSMILEELAEHGTDLYGAVLRNTKLLPVFARIYLASEGDAGESVAELILKLLRLPDDVIIMAAEKPKSDLMMQLCGDGGGEDATTDTDEDEDDTLEEEAWDPHGHDRFTLDPGAVLEALELVGAVPSGARPSICAGNTVRESISIKSKERVSEVGELPETLPDTLNRREADEAAERAGSRRVSIAVSAVATARKMSRFAGGDGRESMLENSVRFEGGKVAFDGAKARKSFLSKRRNTHAFGSQDTEEPDTVKESAARLNRRPSFGGQALAIEFANKCESPSDGHEDGEPRPSSPGSDLDMTHVPTIHGLEDLEKEWAKSRPGSAGEESISREKAKKKSRPASPTTKSKSRPGSPGRRKSKSRPASPDKSPQGKSRPGSPGWARSRPGSPSSKTRKDDDFYADWSKKMNKKSRAGSPIERTFVRRKSKAGVFEGMSSRWSDSNEGDFGEMGHLPSVEMSYPTLPPLWPAFTDVQFIPKISWVNAEGVTEGRLDMLRFGIQPSLPASVTIDLYDGTISGSLMVEQLAGCQYTVTAWWDVSEQIAGRCAIAFAVVGPELAAVCNEAYLLEIPPAFRSPAERPRSNQIASCRDGGTSEQEARESSALPHVASMASIMTASSVDSCGKALLHGPVDIDDLPPCHDGAAKLLQAMAEKQAGMGSHVSSTEKFGASSNNSSMEKLGLGFGIVPTTPRVGSASRRPMSMEVFKRPIDAPSALNNKFGGGRLWSAASTGSDADVKSRSKVFPLGPPLKKPCDGWPRGVAAIAAGGGGSDVILGADRSASAGRWQPSRLGGRAGNRATSAGVATAVSAIGVSRPRARALYTVES